MTTINAMDNSLNSIQQREETEENFFFKFTKDSGVVLSVCSAAYAVFNKCGAVEFFKDMDNYSAKCPCTGACTSIGGPGTWLMAGALGCLMIYGFGKMVQNTVRSSQNTVTISRSEYEQLLAARKNH